MSSRVRIYSIVALSFFAGWVLHPFMARNIETVMERHGWDRLLDNVLTALPDWLVAQTASLSAFWAGALLVLLVWGLFEASYAIGRRATAAAPPAQPSAFLPPQADRMKRSFNLTDRQRLLALLNERIPGKGYVQVEVHDKREIEIANETADVFNLAGWQVYHNSTVQDSNLKGVRVSGFNSLFVDSVTACLLECGVSDAYRHIQPTEIPQNHVKWDGIQKRVEIQFGYQ